MFDTLSESLQKVFRNLRGYGKLSEKNISDALREVRMALLEADVNFQVAKEFIARVKEKCLGEEVLASVTPGQQVIKRVHEEMVALLGGEHRDFVLKGKPAGVLLLGLHGAGKTTTCSKLARQWKQSGRKVLLVACDIRRPAAVEQLSQLARQVGVGIVTPQPGETVPAIGVRAVEHARSQGYDVVIYDTGGRFQIESELVAEVRELRERVQPENVVLVLDAAIGQESVHVAETFHREVGLTGLILTKLDGDARGGAALSVQSVTRCPILRVGVGERPEDLEEFFPDRMASRILGMGDVISFVEKAQASLDVAEAAKMEEKLRKNTLDLEDFLSQIQQMKKLGPIDQIFDMMPGAPKMDGAQKQKVAEQSTREMRRSEAIIRSMTPLERRKPASIDASRRRRIAKGSGTTVRDVNELLKRFEQTRSMAKNMKKMQKKLLRFAK